MQTEIHIPLDKKKSRLRLIGALVLVIFGMLFILQPQYFIRSSDPYMIRLIGYFCVGVFGIMAFFLGRYLRSQKGGIRLHATGITDDSSGVAPGLILWKDIRAIQIQQLDMQSFLLIQVRNPEAYIQKQNNPIKRRAMELNYQIYKTPISISAHFVKMDFDSLAKTVMEQFEKQKK